MVTVGNFHIDKTPVTNQQFAKFVANNPKWQKQNIAKLFAEPDYLAHWQKQANAIIQTQSILINLW